MKWGEWRMLCDTALGYYWPSIHQREDHLLWVILDHQAMTNWMAGCQEKMMLIAGEQDGMRFCHTTWNGTQFKTYELFISGIFHLLFSDHGWPWVTETSESQTADKVGGLLYSFVSYCGFHSCLPCYAIKGRNIQPRLINHELEEMISETQKQLSVRRNDNSNKPLTACKVSTTKKMCLWHAIKTPANLILLSSLKIYSWGSVNINPPKEK